MLDTPHIARTDARAASLPGAKVARTIFKKTMMDWPAAGETSSAGWRLIVIRARLICGARN